MFAQTHSGGKMQSLIVEMCECKKTAKKWHTYVCGPWERVFPAKCIGSKMTDVGQEVIGSSWIFIEIELVGKVACQISPLDFQLSKQA